MHRSWPLLLLAAATLLSCQRTQVVDGFPPTFVGVGMELRLDGEHPVIVRTLAGGSAEEAGVLANDRLLAIDGRETTGLSLGDVVMQIRGKPGTQVTLTLQRGERRHIIVVRRRKMTKAGEDYAPKAPTDGTPSGESPTDESPTDERRGATAPASTDADAAAPDAAPEVTQPAKAKAKQPKRKRKKRRKR